MFVKNSWKNYLDVSKALFSFHFFKSVTFILNWLHVNGGSLWECGEFWPGTKPSPSFGYQRTCRREWKTTFLHKGETGVFFSKGPRGIWTPVAGFKVQSDNHYTIRPAWGMNPVGMEARRQAPTMGLEPTISPLGGVRRIHWATRADWKHHGTTTCAEFKFFFVKKKTWTEQERFR